MHQNICFDLIGAIQLVETKFTENLFINFIIFNAFYPCSLILFSDIPAHELNKPLKINIVTLLFTLFVNVIAIMLKHCNLQTAFECSIYSAHFGINK